MLSQILIAAFFKSMLNKLGSSTYVYALDYIKYPFLNFEKNILIALFLLVV